MLNIKNYYFEWDPGKDKLNRHKHGLSFSRAATTFLDSRALTIFDANHSTQEERWITMGLDSFGTVSVISHTFIAETETDVSIRIISARKATNKEANQYFGR